MSQSLKWSWKLDNAGNFEMNKDGKIKTVEEKENFSQVIVNILQTIQGSDILSPWFGNPLLNGVASRRNIRDPTVYIESSIRKALLPENEPRIKEIEELYIEEIVDRTYKINLTVIDIYGTRTQIESRLMV